MAVKSGSAVERTRQYSAGEVTVTGVESIFHNPSLGAGDVVTIRPVDGTIYIGGVGVVAASGFPVNAGESFELRASGSPLYAITSGASVKVRKLVEVLF